LMMSMSLSDRLDVSEGVQRLTSQKIAYLKTTIFAPVSLLVWRVRCLKAC
jgi:hypothetical protein